MEERGGRSDGGSDLMGDLSTFVGELSKSMLGVSQQSYTAALDGEGVAALRDFVDEKASMLVLVRHSAPSSDVDATKLVLKAASLATEVSVMIKGGSCAIVVAKANGHLESALPLSQQLLVTTLTNENLVDSLLTCIQKSVMPLLEGYFSPVNTRSAHIDAANREKDFIADPVAASLVRKKVCTCGIPKETFPCMRNAKKKVMSV